MGARIPYGCRGMDVHGDTKKVESGSPRGFPSYPSFDQERLDPVEGEVRQRVGPLDGCGRVLCVRRHNMSWGCVNGKGQRGGLSSMGVDWRIGVCGWLMEDPQSRLE